MDLSFVTSVYRAAAFLPVYSQRVLAVSAALAAAGLTLEVVVIANDPMPDETALLEALAEAAARQGSPHIQRHSVPREGLYASWNRGISLTTGAAYGFWNVDDTRHVDALLAGLALLRQGYTLVDAPLRVVQPRRLLGRVIGERVHITPVLYHPDIFTRKATYGPFALHDRALFDQVGPFDEHFRVAGDIEWGARARQVARFQPLPMPGGTFYLHANNLSSHNSAQQLVEENIVFMRFQRWSEVRPTPDPVLMRRLWEDWGNPAGISVPPEVADQLWGSGALAAWQRWQHDQRRYMRSLALRRLPRALIDRLGLRPHLARVGLVQPGDAGQAPR